MESEERVVYVNVDEILVPEERVTSVLDSELLEELERSIREHGILQPLQIALVNNKYVLVDGLHRLIIAKKLNMKTVPCIVKPMSEQQLLITNLIMNRQRGRSNPADEARVLVKLIDEYGVDFDEACKAIGFSRGTGDKYYRIGKYLDEDVLKMLGDGLISVGCAYWFTFIDDKEKQKMLAQYAARWGYTVEQCKVAVQAELNPSTPLPYEISPTGEMKPKPVPVYPCGVEVEPENIVAITFDKRIWPEVEQALKQLCNEGFFYGGEEKKTEEKTEEKPPAQPQPQPQPQQPKRDWFTEML